MVGLDMSVRPNESNTEAFGLSSWDHFLRWESPERSRLGEDSFIRKKKIGVEIQENRSRSLLAEQKMNTLLRS